MTPAVTTPMTLKVEFPPEACEILSMMTRVSYSRKEDGDEKAV